ncbi:MAG TPA: hypothetical protein VG168_01595, partial [Bryobacteraceae bacterium]|nr:hypothetical protein [Bryobacteraceae bacterium]
PSNGDVNPYGVAFAPKNIGAGWTLQAGDILVSNFNDYNNLQGRGTTIVRIDKTGHVSTFYTSSKAGLSAAIGVLSNGMVLIGNTPTVDGTANTIQSGALSVLNGSGQFLGTLGTSTVSMVLGAWPYTIRATASPVRPTCFCRTCWPDRYRDSISRTLRAALALLSR